MRCTYVGGLEVPVDDLVRVDVAEAARELGDDVPYVLHLDGPPLVRIEVGRERVVGQVLLHHVEVLRRLERVAERDYVRVVALLQALQLARAVQLPAAGALRTGPVVRRERT